MIEVPINILSSGGFRREYNYFLITRSDEFLLFRDFSSNEIVVFNMRTQKVIPQTIPPIKFGSIIYLGDTIFFKEIYSGPPYSPVFVRINNNGILEITKGASFLRKFTYTILLYSEKTPLKTYYVGFHTEIYKIDLVNCTANVDEGNHHILSNLHYGGEPWWSFYQKDTSPIFKMVYCFKYNRPYAVYYFELEKKPYIIVFDSQGNILGFSRNFSKEYVWKQWFYPYICGRYLYSATCRDICVIDLENLTKPGKSINMEDISMKKIDAMIREKETIMASPDIYIDLDERKLPTQNAIPPYDGIPMQRDQDIFSIPYITVSKETHHQFPALLQQEIFIGLLLAKRYPMKLLPEEILWYIFSWLV